MYAEDGNENSEEVKEAVNKDTSLDSIVFNANSDDDEVE